VKILLDAQLSPDIADLLVKRGYDADPVLSRPDIADNTPDEGVIESAHREQRAVVTNNIKDYRPIAAQRIAGRKGHSGLILVPANRPRNKAAAKSLADGIERIMQANPTGLADSERWI